MARMFKIKQPSVSEWRKTGIPSARLQLLEVVRPDIFGASPTNHRQEVSDAA
ncbi:Rha family transcriptional regulator [Xylella fastidiosa]|uniref:Rha family transcriptional regulator n=1 Tax=Xylella fastidiosa TaxID=2371 RepID=UPI00249E32DD|nr:Rha family transcriptional regulator [Xylella fastidiosa]WGZ34150.1 Rha family transcriptional regulator [Xylella fastidiosa subsp. pauca]